MNENAIKSVSDSVSSKKSDSIENQQLSYWCKLFEKPLCSPQEFYALVEENLSKWNVPALSGGYIDLREGNIFSDKRLYLQLNRELLVFEVCAAPFGTGYFVSARLFDRRRYATLKDFIGLLIFIGLLSAVFWYMIGFLQTVFLMLFALIGVVGLIKSASPSLIRKMDGAFPQLPCIGPIYESLAHPLTNFRIDQNNMYQQAVHQAVMTTVDALNQKVGIKPLTAEERKPTIRQMFGK